MSNARYSRLFPRLAIAGVVFAAAALIATTSYAVFEGLGPSKDDWGLKFDVQVTAAEGNKLNVDFTLTDAGRMKPLHSVLVVAFSAPDGNGARRWDMKTPIPLQSTTDGHRAGQVQIPREFGNRALIRFMTQTVDGKRVQGVSAAYYEVPLRKFMR